MILVSLSIFFCIKLNLPIHTYVSFNTDPSTEFAECTTGEVRLTDFIDNSSEDSRQGTAQICINNAWGSVCSDNFFDAKDAAVFCDILEGFSGSGKLY